jgi:PhnB protein
MTSRIAPYLLYEDGAAAMDFIRDAFGFEEVLRSHSPEGRMWHGELRLGDASVFVGEPGGDYKSPKRLGQTTVGIHVYVDDVDAHHKRAKAAGAEIVNEPADQE